MNVVQLPRTWKQRRHREAGIIPTGTRSSVNKAKLRFLQAPLSDLDVPCCNNAQPTHLQSTLYPLKYLRCHFPPPTLYSSSRYSPGISLASVAIAPAPCCASACLGVTAKQEAEASRDFMWAEGLLASRVKGSPIATFPSSSSSSIRNMVFFFFSSYIN